MTSKQIQDDTSRDTLYRIHQLLISRQMAKAVLVGASDWRKPFAVVGAAGFLVSILLFVLLKEPVVDAKVTEQRPENFTAVVTISDQKPFGICCLIGLFVFKLIFVMMCRYVAQDQVGGINVVFLVLSYAGNRWLLQ